MISGRGRRKRTVAKSIKTSSGPKTLLSFVRVKIRRPINDIRIVYSIMLMKRFALPLVTGSMKFGVGHAWVTDRGGLCIAAQVERGKLLKDGWSMND